MSDCGLVTAARHRRSVLGVLVAALLCANCTGPDERATTTQPAVQGSTTTQSPTLLADGSYQWRRLPIGAGGYTTGLVIHPTSAGVMYARTDTGGAYRWDPATETWAQLLTTDSVITADRTPGDYSVESIAVAPTDPNIVYIAIGNDGDPTAGRGRIMRTDDGGRHWTSSTRRWFIAGNALYRQETERLAVDPLSADHVLFGSRRDGLWSTTDGGVTWTQVALAEVPTGLFDDPTADQAGVSFTAFGFGPSGAASAAFAGVANKGIYESSDATHGWKLIVPAGNGDYPSGGTVVDGQLFAAIDRSSDTRARLVRYDRADGATTEIHVPRSSANLGFAVDPNNVQHLVLTDEGVRNGHLWTSTDGGASWNPHDIRISSDQIPWLAQTDLADFMSPGRFVFDPVQAGHVWFAEGMAVWETDDIDAHTVAWRSRSQGIEQTVTAEIVVPPGGAAISAIADRQGFLSINSTTYPNTPLIDRQFASGTSVDYSGGHPDVVAWVGAESNIYSLPSRAARGAISNNGGETWTEFAGTVPAMFGGEVAVSALDPDIVVWVPTHFDDPSDYLTDPVGVYVSQNGGRSWTHTANVDGLDSFHRFFWWFTRRALAADRVNGNFYLMSDEGPFFVSTDGAMTWTAAAFAPPCTQDAGCHVFGQVQAMPGRPDDLWASVGVGGMYTSTDAGESPWRRLDGLAEARAFGFGAPAKGSLTPTIFVYGRASAADHLSVLASTDSGATWNELSAAPLGLYGDVTTVAGDPNAVGRVLVGFSGLGFVVGNP